MNALCLAIEITFKSRQFRIEITSVEIKMRFLFFSVQLFTIIIINVLVFWTILCSFHICKLAQWLGRFFFLRYCGSRLPKVHIFRPSSIIINTFVESRFFGLSFILSIWFYRVFIFFVSTSLKCLLHLLFCGLFTTIPSPTWSLSRWTRLTIVSRFKLSCFCLVSRWVGIFALLGFFITVLTLLHNLEPVFLLEFVLFGESLTENRDFS